ncbi:MAG: NAD(+)/NADH kinase [Acidimicrobiales bacterium]
MSTIGVLVHQEREQAAAVAREVITWLQGRDQRVWLPFDDAARIGLPVLAAEAREAAPSTDVVVSIGGDGTMLRAVDMAAPHDVGIIGVNVGQMGYLTEVEPDGWPEALERWLAGDYTIDERMLLSVAIEHTGRSGRASATVALNEAVLEKTPMGHTVRLSVDLNDEFFTTYAADGLIVATPTGSTAYAFSARGPIVAPGLRALMLTPVSPHMLFDRTLVLEPTTTVRLTVCGHRPATLSVDGRNLGQLEAGDALVCTASGHRARLVGFGDRYFHQIVKAKFGLEDR